MFGGLHIKMVMWNTLGDYLESSCWTITLTQTGIASSGMAILKSSHLTRTRHSHQVSALALAKLRQDAFLKMVTEDSLDDVDKEAWRLSMSEGGKFHLIGILMKDTQKNPQSFFMSKCLMVLQWYISSR